MNKARQLINREWLAFFLIEVGIFLAILLVLPLNVFTDFIVRNAVEKTNVAVFAGFEEEKETLRQHARQLTNLEISDVAGLALRVSEEKQRRKIDGLIVTDDKGVVLVNAAQPSQKGQLFFHSVPWSKDLSQNKEVVAIDRDIIFPLVIAAGRPLVKDSRLAGSVIAEYVVNSDYAISFKERYLAEGAQVVFYNLDTGLIGSSFGDLGVENLLASYFSTGSDFLLTDREEITMTVGGKSYLVKNLAIGEDQAQAGVIIFVPLNNNLQNLLLALFLSLIFAVILFVTFRSYEYRHHHHHHHHHKFHNVIFLASLLIIFFVSFLVSWVVSKRELIVLKKPAYVIYNSTLEFDPAVTVFDQFFEQRVAIKLVSGGEAINAAEVVINYDPEAVEVEEIITEKSICNQDLFLEKNINNERGEVRVTCLAPEEFNEKAGILAELVLKPIKQGVFVLDFNKESNVLAADGLGTNVLRQTTGGSYTVPGEKTLLFSPTHPNSARWYGKRTILFTWPNNESKEFYYVFDRLPETMPTGEQITKGDALEFEAQFDGVYYLHLVAADRKDDVGSISHYPVMIDSLPPLPPKVRVSEGVMKSGEIVRFEFSGSDQLSGLQKNFYIKIDGSIYLPVGPQLFTTFFERGDHRVTVRVFDNARNFNETTRIVTVE